jgi:hypothetical protein
VNIAAIVLWTFAVVLLVIGIIFAVLGMNSERGYWSQRDPSGNARNDATRFSAVMRRAGHYATGEYRAPLRIAAIGVLLGELAVGFAIVALIVTLAG